MVFDSLNASTDPAMVKEWVQQEEATQKDRQTNPEAMDIFDLKIPCSKLIFGRERTLSSDFCPGKMSAQFLMELLVANPAPTAAKSSSLITEGLKLEEAQ